MRDRIKAGSVVSSQRAIILARLLRIIFSVSLFGFAFVSELALAEDIYIVSSKLKGPHYVVAREMESRLKSVLPSNFKIRFASVSDEALRINAGPKDYILTIGSQAFADVVENNSTTNLIATLIPRVTYQSLLQANPRKAGRTSAVYIEQPVQRNLELVRIALPGRKPGILLGPQSGALEKQLHRISKELNLPLYLKTLKPNENLVAGLDQVLKNCDVLVAFADHEVSNPGTARHLLLTSYRYGIPVVAYSRAYVRAGALMAVYSTPEQFARQTTELLVRTVQDKGDNVPVPEYPIYFSVDINQNVARSLGIDLESALEIESRLRSMGRAGDE